MCIHGEIAQKTFYLIFGVCVFFVCACVLPFFVYAQAKCVGCDTLSLRASERAEPKREQMLQKSGESESESPVALMEYMNE